MNSKSKDPIGGPESSKFHTVQPLRDLESNWGVDLAKSLEDYLLKICSGEINDADEAHFSVNFAEAALLVQGSVQVYSRKVEYLYNLVLHTLEFISQSRSQDHAESSSVQAEASSSSAVHDEDDQYWVLDEIPVKKNCLGNATRKDTSLDRFIKPPANLVVLEGECLDSTGDGGELESYLLATNTLYRDFILLDPFDGVTVDEFLKGDESGEGQYYGHRGSSLISKAHKSFLSPLGRQSGGTARKSSAKRGQGTSQDSPVCGVFENPNHGFEPGPSNFGTPHGNYGFESDDHHSQQGGFDDSDGDEDDPWKPLNPHEPGNLKVKPFKKVKVPRRLGMTKHSNTASQFPLAKLHGTITPELTRIWEMGLHRRERQEEPQSPRLYEKLRESLVHGGNASHDSSLPPGDGDAENIFDDGIDDGDQPEFGFPDTTFMDEGANIQSDKHDDYGDHCDIGHAEVNDDPNSQASLEDLCRAHLDSLLASIEENEKQTELAARVSTWKQRIEHDLEEEDSRPPFDIHVYGETILDRLSLNEGENVTTPFTDVVKGQEKHDIARSFSALLQLVNDRKVDLDKSTSVGDSFCFTAENPFRVQLLSNEKGPKKMHFQPTKKRQKSPIKREPSVASSPSSEPKSKPNLAQPSCKFSAKLGKNGGLRCSPDRKRRRKSRLAESVDLSSLR